MFQVALTLEIGGESHQVTAEPRDLLTWERTSKGRKIGELLPINEAGDGIDATRLSLVEIYRLAHIVAKRHGLFSGPLDQFEQDVVVILEGADAPDPTKPAASAGSTSSSRSRQASRPASGQKKGQQPRAPRSSS